MSEFYVEITQNLDPPLYYNSNVNVNLYKTTDSEQQNSTSLVHEHTAQCYTAEQAHAAVQRGLLTIDIVNEYAVEDLPLYISVDNIFVRELVKARLKSGGKEITIKS